MDSPGKKEETIRELEEEKETGKAGINNPPGFEPLPDDKLIGDDFHAEKAGTVAGEEPAKDKGPANY